MKPLPAHEFEARLRRLDTLIEQADRRADADAVARAAVQAVLDLHDEALEELLVHLDDSTPDAPLPWAPANRAGGPPPLRVLLRLDLEARVAQALERVRAEVGPLGREVELIGVADGVVQVRIDRCDEAGPSSVASLSRTIESAIRARAPEVTGLEVEGRAPPPAGTAMVAL
jgi:hypothetical protein